MKHEKAVFMFHVFMFHCLNSFNPKQYYPLDTL